MKTKIKPVKAWMLILTELGDLHPHGHPNCLAISVDKKYLESKLNYDNPKVARLLSLIPVLISPIKSIKK